MDNLTILKAINAALGELSVSDKPTILEALNALVAAIVGGGSGHIVRDPVTFDPVTQRKYLYLSPGNGVDITAVDDAAHNTTELDFSLQRAAVALQVTDTLTTDNDVRALVFNAQGVLNNPASGTMQVKDVFARKDTANTLTGVNTFNNDVNINHPLVVHTAADIDQFTVDCPLGGKPSLVIDRYNRVLLRTGVQAPSLYNDDVFPSLVMTAAAGTIPVFFMNLKFNTKDIGPVLVAPDASLHRLVVANDGTLSTVAYP